MSERAPTTDPVAPPPAASLADRSDEQLAEILGDRLVLRERIARGPFADVWRADEIGTGRPVAVKVARDATGARMLREEVEVVRRLVSHRAAERSDRIVPILASSLDEPAWIVMPWIPGRSLREDLRAVRTRDDRAVVLRDLLTVMQTVATVHDRGVVHGDLKPENVITSREHGPMLTDFGLARERQSMRRTQTLRHSLDSKDAIAGGTLAYLPPEAVKGAEPSARGDVYALGVMLHEALTGRRPDKATSPEALREQLPEAIVAVLCRALAFAPEDRFADARALHAALIPLRDELLATGASRRWRAVRRAFLAAAAAFFVAFRYASVLAVLACYAACAAAIVAPFVMRRPDPGLALGGVCLGLPTLLFFQIAIRWEGPESGAEASARQAHRARLAASARPGAFARAGRAVRSLFGGD